MAVERLGVRLERLGVTVERAAVTVETVLLFFAIQQIEHNIWYTR